MNTEALFLFVILLLGLILCSFLGGSYNKESFTSDSTMTTDNSIPNVTPTPAMSNNVGPIPSNKNDKKDSGFDNYNHFTESFTTLTTGHVFYGPNGGSIKVITNSDGSESLSVVTTQGGTAVIYNSPASDNLNSASTRTYYGPNGGKGTIVTTNDGTQGIRIVDSNGNAVTYTQNATIYNPTNNNPNYNNTATTYYGSTGTYNTGSNTAYNTNNGVNAGSVSGPGGNTAYYAQGPYGNTAVATTDNNSGQYNNALPQGIPASQIPQGDEDLYILKSQVVPPVCPACPSSSACPRQEKCPPCPACARCPEPSFECKKVPNYNAINNEYLPIPVLNDFSTFGM